MHLARLSSLARLPPESKQGNITLTGRVLPRRERLSVTWEWILLSEMESEVSNTPEHFALVIHRSCRPLQARLVIHGWSETTIGDSVAMG